MRFSRCCTPHLRKRIFSRPTNIAMRLAACLNRRGGSGHLYQNRLKAFPVAEDEHLLTLLRYVEGNPLRAGLVRRAEDWRARRAIRPLFLRGSETMVTDPLFYRLFETSPETFFLLLGMPVDAATQMAARYQYQAIEFKETSHRTDGVFLPKEPGLPLYFLEVQFYPLPSVFADMLAK